MKSEAQRKLHKKIALAISMCTILVWAILGTGASLAWFKDTSPEITNIFHFADFELEVSHRLPNGTYEKIDGQTKIFDEEALYEPGYVQVVYLKIVNKGDIAFDFKTAVNVTDYTVAGEDVYMALIVRMPEEVGNEANYREDAVPKVELGIIVSANQQRPAE